MLGNLGWQSLENRRIDSRLTMFYEMVYGLVAIPLPSYFAHPEVYTRHMHSHSYRQIHTSTRYYQYSFFPMTVVLWNKLPADLVLVSDLDSFKAGVSMINHIHHSTPNVLPILLNSKFSTHPTPEMIIRN